MSHPVPHLPAEPDDLDRLFAAYFKKQLPARWPDCPAPLAEPARAAGLWNGSSTRSRVTLAVSVAALLGLGLTVSSGPRSPTGVSPANSPSGMGAPTASPSADLKARLDKIAADKAASQANR